MSHLPLDTTYPLQLTIKGEIKGLQVQGIILDQLLQGFYIRNSTGLTNGKPSWAHEKGIRVSIWFANASKSWMVGKTNDIGSNSGVLAAFTSPDNSVPQEGKNWEYVDQTGGKWIMSSDISIKRGM